jgi:hypothetical protein
MRTAMATMVSVSSGGTVLLVLYTLNNKNWILPAKKEMPVQYLQ